MKYLIRIKRQNGREQEPCWQEFFFEGDSSTSVASVLNELNGRDPLVDRNGAEAEHIFWECGCMIRKCGACAMRINGLPRLACSTFLRSLKGNTLVLEPLSKFPLVKDLVVDRTVVFEKLKEINLWLESEAFQTGYTFESRFQSARCLLCGCCLEVCPNFNVEGKFGGAILPVNSYRILNEEQDTEHRKVIADKYGEMFFEGCGRSMACHNICPVGLPVEELMVRSNAVAVWKK